MIILCPHSLINRFPAIMKLDKRKLLGPLFAPLSKAKHSRASRIIVATLWLPSQLIRKHLNYPYFAVNISSAKGMGAVLVEALLMCHYAEKNGLTPRITSTNRLYAPRSSEDFINLYLGPADQVHGPNLRPMRFNTLWSFYHLNFAHHMSLAEANQLFWAYFPPKPMIIGRVDAVLAGIPNRKFDLSVHYRGTDKVLEAPLVGFEVYEKAILDYQARGGSLQSVFLATDDTDFEAFVRQRFPRTVFTTYNLGSTFDTSRGRHFSDMNPEDKSIEALVNMFLLAAAPTCIRGASYMSAISKILNPALRTVSLNRTHWGSSGFPEYEILAEEDCALRQ
jgi:hypothetical protein